MPALDLNYPPPGDPLSVGAACARFCEEWHGTDAADGARALLAMLPPRIPGALRLAIARALRDLDVPAFASADEFRSAVERFAERAGESGDAVDIGELELAPAPIVVRGPARRRHARRLPAAAAAAAVFVLGVLAGQFIDARQVARRVSGLAAPAAQYREYFSRRDVSRTADAGLRAPTVTSTAGVSTHPSARRSTAVLLRRIGTGAADAFSPWFSRTGSAVFFHRDEGMGSALVKAETDTSTGDPRVITILGDGARNYHVRPSPDGTRIAFDSDRDGGRGVYLANADGSNVRRVSGPGLAALPSWSPDGRRLSFVRGESRPRGRAWNLWLLDVPSGALVRLTSYADAQPWGASWFPDGRRLAYSQDDRLIVQHLETGARRAFASPREGRPIRTPAVSPDGRYIVFQVSRDGVWMLDVKTRTMRRILADPTAEEFAWDAAGRRLAFHSRRAGSWSVWVMAADR